VPVSLCLRRKRKVGGVLWSVKYGLGVFCERTVLSKYRRGYVCVCVCHGIH
jgi:hypothetical protein